MTIRRGRRPREAAVHPDVHDPDVAEVSGGGDLLRDDAAVDFVAMRPLVERMRTAFFHAPAH